MEKRLQDRLSGCIRQVVTTLQLRAENDQELLRRFVVQHDEAAFAAIVRRHGPMILRVASRTLQNGHDAEDVFQATFLVLSQKAQTLRQQESLGSWLFGTAYRLALKSKAMAGERRNREKRSAMTHVATPLAQITVREAQEILEEEISRLPEKFREPVVLCCLEGLTRDEAAQQIGCTASALKGRLELARERLRQRLVARGLTLPCSLGALLLLEGVVGAAVPQVLISSTTKAAIAVVAGQAVTTVATAKVAALTEGAIQTMFVTKIRIASVALMLGFLVMGGTVLTNRMAAAPGDHLLIEIEQAALERKPDHEQEKENRLAFEMRDQPWARVLERLTDLTGLPIVSENARPPGTFTFVGPKDKLYTITEVFEIVNKGLDRHNLMVIRQEHSLTIVSKHDAARKKTAQEGKGSDAAQDTDPEKLYRAMEKKVRAAKSLHVALDSDVDSQAIKGTGKATIYATEGNKSRMEIDFDIDGIPDKQVMF
ncbi:MAG: hypothetical protein C5B49_08950 [Bdellovibrio sp.]|nr:MAG: hypothetical protein C5B49_08950 [Bdellovibrio sp.]